MKQAHGWMLQHIKGIPYILPYGQNIADFRRGIQINDTGAALWELLQKEHSEREVIDLFLTHYQISDKEKASVTKDLQQFLSELSNWGMLQEDSAPAEPSGNFVLLSIGGFTLRLFCPEELFPENFKPFVISHSKNIHQTIEICPFSCAEHPNGSMILRNEQLVVCRNKNGWLLFFPQMPGIHEAHLSKDGSYVRFYCTPPFDSSLRENLFHAIRLSFLYFAQKHGLFALHSASILYKGKAWLFSGHSGMGKSTHTNLWKKLFEVPILNGDLNLLSVHNGKALVSGLPWCGTSGIFTTKDYPLGGIVLLHQGTDNALRLLRPEQQQLLVMQRFISPTWTKAQVRCCLNFAEKLAEQIPIVSYTCTKEEDAAFRMKEWIDRL